MNPILEHNEPILLRIPTERRLPLSSWKTKKNSSRKSAVWSQKLLLLTPWVAQVTLVAALLQVLLQVSILCWISLIRRSMPKLIAYDICGVQPMTGPTGLIFAMRSTKGTNRDINNSAVETFFNEVDSEHSSENSPTVLPLTLRQVATLVCLLTALVTTPSVVRA